MLAPFNDGSSPNPLPDEIARCGLLRFDELRHPPQNKAGHQMATLPFYNDTRRGVDEFL